MDFPKIEEKILKFWKENKIFEKTLRKTQKRPRFIFYEGPPFANGLPGIHHLLARAFKDVILRYKTMQGFFVERRAGWDTHGLPTEMEAEKKLAIKNKKEIEKIGIEEFIEECKRNVFTYKKEWEEFSERIGFWLDFENAYITCSNDYIETLWWILKQIWEKKLLYQDFKVTPYCPRCGTSLSSHEVAQGYKKIAEPAIYVKLKIKSQKLKLKPNTYILVWTTTPWTLPGNVAVAVNPRFTYVKVKLGKEFLILAKDRLRPTLHPLIPQVPAQRQEGGGWVASHPKKEKERNYQIIDEFKGKELLGLEYEPLFDFVKPDKKAYLVVAGDFVSLDEGTGIVHIAPAFGEDDMAVSKENNLPLLMTVDEEGKFKKEVKDWAGMFVKDADPLIIEDLEKRELLYKKEMYEHDYPFCWRCKTPLLYYAKYSWFAKVIVVKKELIKNNKKINWVPEYIKKGRFGEWLKEVKDWNLSRERYWGTPLPIWECQRCKKQICIGEIKELARKSKMVIKDLHRPFIDEITFKCECGGLMKRVPDVIDCWFDSGSMPFAQWHYPFENKDRIDKGEFFPADFISEGIDQTRGWFYTLLAISTLLEKGISYKNVICLGLVLDAKGQKMSKSRGNIIIPQEVIDKFGADCARLYFYTLNQAGETKRFDFKDVQSLHRKFFDTLWQSYNFFSTYSQNEEFELKENFKSEDLLDRWIISRLENLNFQLTKNLDNYNVVSAARLFVAFVDELSNWYIRRSRKRFQKPKRREEKTEASQTLYYVLLKFVKLIAPFTPFISEELYYRLKGDKESVHLACYPESDKKLIDKKLEEKMIQVREIIAAAAALRAKTGIKVRQPLKKLKIKNEKLKMSEELLDLIKEEVNVKEVIFDSKIKETVELDTKITPELKEEGQVREFIRQVQEMRKRQRLTPKDKIVIYCKIQEKIRKVLQKNEKVILAETRAKELKFDKLEQEGAREVKISDQNLTLAIKVIS